MHTANHLLLKLFKKFLRRGSEYIMNFVHLIKFVISGKQGEQSQDFKIYTTYPPVIHLMVVVAIGQQTLRRPIPSGGYILCERGLGVDPPAGSKVCQFHMIVLDKNVLAMKQKVRMIHHTYGLISL